MHLPSSFHKKRTSFRKFWNKCQIMLAHSSDIEGNLGIKLMYLALFISNAQLLFQMTHLTQQYFPKASEQYSIISTLQDIFMIEDILNYDQRNNSFLFGFSCIVIYLTILTTTFLILVQQTSKEPNQIKFSTKKVWSLLIRLHGPVFFFPINNICNRFQKVYFNDNLESFYSGGINGITFYCSIIVCFVNILYAVLPYIFLFDILPSQNPLSSKNFLTDQVALWQKILLSLFSKIIPNTSLAGWLFLCFAASLSIMRHFWCLYFLPKYQFRALAIDLYMMNICTLTVVISLFLFGLNKAFDVDVTMISFDILLLLLCPLAVIFTHNIFNQTIKQLIFRPHGTLNPYKAIHKTFMLKFLQKFMKIPTWRTKEIDINYFYSLLVQRVSDRGLSIKNTGYSLSMDSNARNIQNSMKRDYLERLMIHYSNVDEIKLLLARFYAKNVNLYILAIKTLNKIKCPSMNIRTSISLLHVQIQQQILRQSRTGSGEDLNLYEYFVAENQKEGLKEQIKRQLEYHSLFWKEYSKNEPDILELHNLSDLIHNQKKQIDKEWIRLENESNKGFNYLYSLYGYYQFLLNNSPSQGKQYLTKYHLINIKNTQQNDLTVSNLCDQNNFSITISTSQDKLGNIVNCSNIVSRTLGYEKKDIIGSNIGILMTSYIAERHNNFLQDFIKSGISAFFGRKNTVFIKDNSNSLRKVSIWTNVYPFIQGEIRLTGLFRIVDDPKEYIFLNPQGEIDSYTKKIASILNIQGKKIHINSICSDFPYFNEAYSPLSPKVDNENLRLTSAAENSLASARNLLSPKEKNQSPVYKSKVSALVAQSEYKLEEIPKNLQLNFNPYIAEFHKINEGFQYECEIRTMPVRENLITFIEIDMPHEKEPGSPQKVHNHIVMQTKIENNGNLTPFEQLSDDYQVGEEILGDLEKHSSKNQINFVNNNKTEVKVINNSNLESSHELLEIKKRRITQEIQKASQINDKSKLDMKNSHMQNQGLENSISGSSTSVKKKKEIYMEDVFEVKHYPKFIKVFLVLLSVLFSAAFILELLLQIKTNNDLKDFKACTTIINIAALRADVFTLIGRGARSAFMAQGGFVPFGSLAHKNTLIGFNGNLATNIPILKNTNSQLQLAIQDIDEIFQEKFKSPNIRMYDINPDLSIGSYQKFNTFSAINLFLEKLLQIYGYFLKTNGFILQQLRYILVNSVNDTLEGTINAINLILENTQLSFKNTVMMLKICQILCLILLTLGVILVIWLLFQVYSMELMLSRQFFGINNLFVQLIREKIDNFEKIIKNDEFLRSEFDLNALSFYEKQINADDKYKIAKVEKTMKTKRLSQLYLKKIICFILVIIAYIVTICFTFQIMVRKIESIRAKVVGLAKVQILLVETSIIGFTVGQILCGDTSTPIRNRLPEEELAADLNNFLNSGRSLLEAFTDENGNYDPIMAPYFFEDSCKFMPPGSTLYSQCLGIVKDAHAFGLFPQFTRFHSLNIQVYQNFKNSDKSFAALSDLVVFIVNNMAPAAGVIREVMQAMVRQIKSNLEDLWSTTTTNFNVFLTLFIVFLLAIGLVSWRYMLKHFVECSNRFKRIMRVVPFNILLKNPTLKGTLMILSKGKLKKFDYDI